MTTIVDGKGIQKEIAENLQKKIREWGKRPHLTLVYIGKDPVIDRYVDLKRAFGENLGVHVNVERFPADLSNEKVLSTLSLYADTETDGIVIQLPLPEHVLPESVLNIIPKDKDVDVLGEEAFSSALSGGHPLPPVVGAIEEIFTRYSVDLLGKKVVIVGRGRLVGKPLSLWLLSRGVPHTVLEKGDDIALHIGEADVVISGTGEAHLITASMVKEGSVIIDAGTSDVGGETLGDVHPDVKEKTSLISSVPGGVGPITIAKLFENLINKALEK